MERQPSLDLYEWSRATAPSRTTKEGTGNDPCSSYRWLVPNVLKLNRRNKISSRPFTIVLPRNDETTASTPGTSDPTPPQGEDRPPQQQSQSWGFKCILVRGLEKGATEAEDPIGVFIEYVGPTQSPESESSPALLRVSCSLLPLSLANSNSSSIGTGSDAAAAPGADESKKPLAATTESETHRFSPENKSVVFRQLIVNQHFNNCEYVSDNGSALLEFQFVVSTEGVVNAGQLADAVAATTQRIGSSFWKGLSALSTGITHLKHSVQETVAQQLHQEVNQTREEAPEPATAAKTAVDEQTLPSLPWETVPPKWHGREDKWIELCTNTLPQNEYTFLSGPEKGLSSDEQVLMAQMGISHKTIMTANSSFDYERDVHEDLLSLDVLRVQRYNLVPGCVSDENFWKNYFWKMAALSSCQTNEQVQIVLSIINAPLPLRPVNRQLSSSPTANRSSKKLPSSEATTAESGAKGATAGHTNVGARSDVLATSLATAVHDAAEAAALVRDLLADAKEQSSQGGSEHEPLVVESDMFHTAVMSCRSQRKALLDLQDQMFAEQQKQREQDEATTGTDSSLLIASPMFDPLVAALKEIDEVLEILEDLQRNAKEQQQKKLDVASAGNEQSEKEEEKETVVAESPPPVAPPAVVPGPDQAALAAKKQEPISSSYDSMGGDDFPELEDIATPDRSGPGAAAAGNEPSSFPADGHEVSPQPVHQTPAGASTKPSANTVEREGEGGGGGGASTGRRSGTNLSDFAKMPWEDEDDDT